jgi:hypothetical protein
MRFIPIFGTETAIPSVVAGLNFEQIEYYPEEAMGISCRFGDAEEGIKVDAYLYDNGLAEIPTNLSSQEVMGCFQEAVQGVHAAEQMGVYLDLKRHRMQYLHLPPDGPDAFCLWASFSYRQKPSAQVVFTGPRVSHLAVRADRGYFNKIRFTYPEDEAKERDRFGVFLRFVVEWAVALNEYHPG